MGAVGPAVGRRFEIPDEGGIQMAFRAGIGRARQWSSDGVERRSGHQLALTARRKGARNECP